MKGFGDSPKYCIPHTEVKFIKGGIQIFFGAIIFLPDTFWRLLE